MRESRRRSGRSSGNPARLRQALGSITPCCPWYLPAQPELVTPVLQVVQRVVVRHLLDGVGVKGEEGHGGAVTLIQRFGSSANLNIHLYCLVLDGVYRCGADGVPTFVEAGAPTGNELHALLHTVITRLMKMLTRRGLLVEEMGQTWLADPNAEGDEARALRPLQAAAIPCRIAFGPRAGEKVLTVQGPVAQRLLDQAQPPGGNHDAPSMRVLDGLFLELDRVLLLRYLLPFSSFRSRCQPSTFGRRKTRGSAVSERLSGDVRLAELPTPGLPFKTAKLRQSDSAL